MSGGRICGSRLTSMTRGRDKATSPRRGRDGPERHEAAEIHRGLVEVVRSQCAQLTALKNRSLRHVQKNSIDRPAEENMIRSARPIRFSKGT